MGSDFTNIQWVVQKNLTSEDVFAHMESACAELGIGYREVTVIPFTHELPEFDRSKKSIFYGSTTFGMQVMNDKSVRAGMFYVPEKFSMEVYFDRWGEHMLNYGATICPLSDINSLKFLEDRLLFIRPDDDSKSFAGIVMSFAELKEWAMKIELSESAQLTINSKIVIAEPLHLKAEWRLWIVKGKVIASTKYRENFILRKESDSPTEVKAFAESRCKEYTPHDVFVMDIALCGDEYLIIECGCMNSAGFYAANIRDVIEQVSKYRVTT